MFSCKLHNGARVNTQHLVLWALAYAWVDTDLHSCISLAFPCSLHGWLMPPTIPATSRGSRGYPQFPWGRNRSTMTLMRMHRPRPLSPPTLTPHRPLPLTRAQHHPYLLDTGYDTQQYTTYKFSRTLCDTLDWPICVVGLLLRWHYSDCLLSYPIFVAER